MASHAGLLAFDWDADITDDERERIIERFLAHVDRWKLRLPAYLAMSGIAPFGNIASTGMIAVSPIAAAFFPGGVTEMQKIVRFLSSRRDMRVLIDRLAEEPDGTR